MTNSFLNKVAAERQVLAIINARFRVGEQLAGLSRSAINIWQHTAGATASNEVVAKLQELAEICQSLSDRSHESFKTLEQVATQKFETELIALKILI